MIKYLLTFSLIYLSACQSTKNFSQINNAEMNSDITKNENSLMQIKAVLDDNPIESKFIQISKAKIEGNALILKIGYSGGCSPHEFKCIGSSMISKSLPPIRNIRLIHSTDDTCREYIESELVVDISDLAYQKRKGSEIKLNIEGYGQLLYSFE